MPYARSSTGYPLEMRELVQRVIDSNAAHTVQCADESQARSLRSRFTQFRSACKRDLRERPPFWTADELERHRAFVAEMEGVEFVVDGRQFIVRPRDRSPVADLLRTARPLDEAQITEDAIAASLEAVLAKTRKGNANGNEGSD